jgi:hypothetical protein
VQQPPLPRGNSISAAGEGRNGTCADDHQDLRRPQHLNRLIAPSAPVEHIVLTP